MTKAQQLVFSVAPLRIGDDLDFAVLETQADGTKKAIRCSAAGRQLGNGNNSDECLGVTGLRADAMGNRLSKGCATPQHFLAPLDLVADRVYYLMVHNHSSAAGFNIAFGDASLLLSDAAPFGFMVGEVFPNPAQTEAFLPIETPTAMNADLLFLRANGQVLHAWQTQLVGGKQQLSLPLPQDYATEMLYVRILIDGAVYHRKVVMMK